MEIDHRKSMEPTSPTIPLHINEKLGAILKSNIITIRFIRSIAHSNFRLVVLKDIDLSSTSPETLLQQCKKLIETNPKLKIYNKSVGPLYFDSLKLYSVPGGAKTSDLSINFDETTEKLLFTSPVNLKLPLAALGACHECEISCFNMKDYEAYKKDPTRKW